MSPLTRQIKRFLPRTLFGRSLIIIVTPMILVQLISTYVFYERHWDLITRRLSSAVAGDVGFVVEQLSREEDIDGREVIFEMAAQHFWAAVSYRPGDILPNQPSEPRGLLEEMLQRELGQRLTRPFLVDARSMPRDVHIKVQMVEGVVDFLIPRERLFSSTTYIFIMWMVGSSLILFAVAVVFMRNQIRPIRRLAAAADAFGKGSDAPGFKPEGASEVRLAASAFIRMRERIQRQISQRTEMLAGVSHDLRTPLTRMRLQLAMMGENSDSKEMRQDIAEMEQMLEGYLAFARGEGSEAQQPIDLARLLREVTNDARVTGRTLSLRTDEPLDVSVQPNAFKRALTNLVQNACRYGKTVQITAQRQDNAVQIIIDDDGPGIPADRREDVFKPFFRLESSRNLKTGGVGLGLTIARDIVMGHGGELLLGDAPLGGLRAIVRIPS
ncbi:MAG: HAMP domain-containing protein [Alphaproteobacteria bacterium]|nr:HAMP domain-containing protein [Alphaproteobacteria bacterium]MBU0796507.1 HAMP domain-containing protein [Alphaproteobacteria bacterium]MBU0888079.1 HAMP domain-containing protein [Alphaproteobacteria bacterium]MBU1811524.1 HAMP domain-containing protein [Alphaproteobacteria bacterium]